MKTLYMSRPLENGEEFSEWAKSQGFKSILGNDDFHVTIAFSREEIDWDKITPNTNTMTVEGGKREVSPLGSEGAVVLKFKSEFLPKRWKELKDLGASWDYEGYQPHVTITYKGTDTDLNDVEPYNGKLVFGHEQMSKLDLDWMDDKN